MNRKIEIWKRKLAKNKLKQEQAMWDKLKYVKQTPLDVMDIKVKRTVINAKARKLDAKWTLSFDDE